MATRTISLLTLDVKSRKLRGVIREVMEEAFKTLNIDPKVLAKRSHAMWDILLVTKSVRLQTEYLDTRKSGITLYGVLLDISEDQVGTFLPNMDRWQMSHPRRAKREYRQEMMYMLH